MTISIDNANEVLAALDDAPSIDPLTFDGLTGAMSAPLHTGLTDGQEPATLFQAVTGGPVWTNTDMVWKQTAGGLPAYYVGNATTAYAQGVQADHNYLHQQGAWRKIIVLHVPSGLSGNHAIFDSNATSTSAVGITLYYDASTNSLTGYVTNGSGGAGLENIAGMAQGLPNSVPLDTPFFVEIIGTIGGRVAMQIFVQGVALHEGHGSHWQRTLPSLSSPPASTHALRLGSFGNGGAYSAIRFIEMWDFQGAMTERESAGIKRHIAERLGIERPGQKITDDGSYDSFPIRIRLGSWQYRYWLRQRKHGIAEGSTVYCERSLDGRTWRGRRRITWESVEGVAAFTVIPIGVTAAGTVIAAGETTDGRTFIQRSTNGINFSGAVEIDVFGAATTHIESNLLVLSSGDSVLIAYSGDGTPCKLVGTADDGLTWTVRGTVGTVGVPGAEASLVLDGTRPIAIISTLAGDGDLYAVVADNDAGTAWGTPVDLGVGIGGRHDTEVLPSGALTIGYRENVDNKCLRAVYLSAADFAARTWGNLSAPIIIDPYPGYYTGCSLTCWTPGIVSFDFGHHLGDENATIYSELYQMTVKESWLATF